MLFPSKSPAADRWLWRVIATGVIAMPLFVSRSGKDSFRLPKEVLFRAEVIVLFTTLVGMLCLKQFKRPIGERNGVVIIAVAAIGWTFTSMLFATNRAVSSQAFAWIAGWTLISVVNYLLARSRGIHAVDIAIIPALINAVVVLLQEAAIWNPFFPTHSEHEFHSGLVGNPDDIGMFLVLPTLATCGLVFVGRSRRVLHAAAAVLLLASAVANHTLTALIALAAGLLAMIFIVSKKAAIVATAVAVLTTIALVRYAPPFRQRYELGKVWVATRNYDTLLSGRMLPYLAASSMFLDHPIVGVGPGCFKWEYFPYKLKITERFNGFVVGWGINFGEVHNDHLQILSEAGLPGYALFILAAVVIGSGTFRPRRDKESLEERFSRLTSFPLMLAFLIVALGQFPLELAAANAVDLYLFALCCAWTPHARTRTDD